MEALVSDKGGPPGVGGEKVPSMRSYTLEGGFRSGGAKPCRE
jgi:hypothetical protein